MNPCPAPEGAGFFDASGPGRPRAGQRIPFARAGSSADPGRGDGMKMGLDNSISGV